VFSIGEFSKITGLTVKTLRFYQEQGLLEPSYVDEQTGYRYYHESKIEVARVISFLRGLELPLGEIAEILKHEEDETQVLAVIQRQKEHIAAQLQRYQRVLREIDQFLAKEREAVQTMRQASFDIQEKDLPAMLVAGVRMRGKYAECGKGFAKIGRQFGRHICGPCFLLHYDMEYHEDDADFEACMPVRQAKQVDGISVRELPAGRAVTLLHQGPYDELGRSYARIMSYLKQQGYEIATPTREVYLKGPGMIFKGNPKKYMTEIQILLAGSVAPR
jgi:DNA-binding transcriptional MerR regulator/DNA gyrase inhibitor GyrI